MAETAIEDQTDQWFATGEGESLETRISAIIKSLRNRIENLARGVATSRSAKTEQGKRFTVYVNGLIKPEGACSVPKIVSGDMGADAQVRALQECAEENFDVILANKPVDDDLLIWRIEPEIRRSLHPDGLHIFIYSRLAWDKLRD